MTVEKARALVAPAFFALSPRSAASLRRLSFTRAALSPARPEKSGGSIRSTARRRPTAGTAPRRTPGTRCKVSFFSSFPKATHARCCRASPTIHVVEGKRVYVADQLGSPPVQPGDTIMLMSGDYGDIVIGDYSKQVVNPSFVTVEAASGQTPVFSTLYIRSTNKWVFKGIKVQSLLGTNNNKLSLVTVTDQGAALPTSDIILQNMQISTADSTDGWTKEQWVAQGRSGYREAGTAGTGANGIHDLRLDDRVAHPERALRRGDLRQQFVVLEQRD